MTLKEAVLLPRKYEKPRRAIEPTRPDWKPASDPKVVAAALEQFRGFALKHRAQRRWRAQRLKKKLKRIKMMRKKYAAKFLSKPGEDESVPEIKSKDVEVKIDKINRKGALAMNFNQDMLVPALVVGSSKGVTRLMVESFFDCPTTGKRRLIGLSEIDLARDLLDF